MQQSHLRKPAEEGIMIVFHTLPTRHFHWLLQRIEKVSFCRKILNLAPQNMSFRNNLFLSVSIQQNEKKRGVLLISFIGYFVFIFYSISSRQPVYCLPRSEKL